MLRIAAGPPQHLAKARVADAKALERVLAQRLAVLTLSARTEEALRAAMPRFAAVRALGKLLPAERKLSVLVARGDLPEAEQALKLISSKDKALFNVQTLGNLGHVSAAACLQWTILQDLSRSMLHVGMHDECEIFLAESALITQAPSLIELAKGFWVTGLKLKISLGLELSIAFDCIQSKIVPMKLAQLVPTPAEKAAFEAGEVISLLEIDQESNQFVYSRCICLEGVQRGHVLALCKSESTLRAFLQAKMNEDDDEADEIPPFHAGNNVVSRQLLRNHGEDAARAPLFYVVRLERGVAILPSYAVVNSVSNFQSKPSEISNGFSELSAVVEQLGLTLNKQIYRRAIRGQSDESQVEPHWQPTCAAGADRVGSRERAQSTGSLEREAQDYAAQIDKLRTQKRKMGPVNRRIRRSILSTVRLAEYFPLRSFKRVRFGPVECVGSKIGRITDDKDGLAHDSSDGGAADCWESSVASLVSGLVYKAESFAASPKKGEIAGMRDDEYEPYQPQDMPSRKTKSRKVINERPVMAKDPASFKPPTKVDLGFTKMHARPNPKSMTVKAAPKKRGASTAVDALVASSTMPTRPNCASCEEKELVKIETNEGYYWACPLFKKFERGRGCGVFISEAEYAELKSDLLDAKEAARLLEEQHHKQQQHGLAPQQQERLINAPSEEKREAKAMKENKTPRDANALEGMGVAAAKASSKTSTKTTPSGNSVPQPSTEGPTAMCTPLTDEQKERIEKNRQQALKRRAQALEKQKQDAEAAAATAIAPAVSTPASDAITGTGSIGVGDGELQAPRAAFEGSVGHEGGEGAKTASSSLEPVSGISAQPPAHRKRKAEVCLDQVDVNGIAEVLKSKSSLLPFFDVEKWRLVLSEKEVHSKISVPIIKAFLHTQKDGSGKKVPVGGKRTDLVERARKILGIAVKPGEHGQEAQAQGAVCSQPAGASAGQ